MSQTTAQRDNTTQAKPHCTNISMLSGLFLLYNISYLNSPLSYIACYFKGSNTILLPCLHLSFNIHYVVEYSMYHSDIHVWYGNCVAGKEEGMGPSCVKHLLLRFININRKPVAPPPPPPPPLLPSSITAGTHGGSMLNNKTPWAGS